ncbi:hypothetical protein [Alteromonas sp. BMJM2]|uniref:hypothetical protein n=1 Tax=Alteromonas sp. BMJM2 TaxID=2954241 RepID=UPI0022B49E7D|nr:hypothetical protein [Alteromonas sp. BMJM2]
MKTIAALILAGLSFPSLANTSEVQDFRPVFKLRNDLQCWPTEPAQGLNSGICNNKSSFQVTPPSVYAESYSESISGNSHSLITYWAYYGNQNGCTTFDSGHSDDWEPVTVHTVNGSIKHVTYWQHNGRYTKPVSEIETDGSHPVVYVGKYSHGNYHDQRSRASFDSWAFGSGDYCYYWKDPRGPGQTWSPGVRALTSVGHNSIFPGSQNPINRDISPHERTVCRSDGGRVLAGIIDGTENTCDRNPSYLKDENMLLKDLFYLDIY